MPPLEDPLEDPLGEDGVQLPGWAEQVLENDPSFDWVPWVSEHYCEVSFRLPSRRGPATLTGT
jgi:hypothetical protein